MTGDEIEREAERGVAAATVVNAAVACLRRISVDPRATPAQRAACRRSLDRFGLDLPE